MKKLTFSERMKAFGIRRVIRYMDKDPDENIPKIIDWLLKHDVGGESLTPLTCSPKTSPDRELEIW